MSRFHSSTERGSSSINVSASTLEVDALIASFDSDPELRDSLQNASVLIIPTDIRPEYEGPAFPETTFEVMERLRESLGDHNDSTVEAAAHDEPYAELAYRSELIILPTLCIVDKILLPIVVSCLASLINDFLKSRGGPKTEDRVTCDIHFIRENNETRLSVLNYDGPADTFERAISQCLADSGPFSDENETHENTENEDSTRSD